MKSIDPRIDAYIARAAPFAQPILRHLREIVHTGCHEVIETIKWGMPFFEHRGPLCHMAAFKQHCAFGFWKGRLFLGDNGGKAAEAMGQFGRITSLADLPAKAELIALVKKAAQMNIDGVKTPRQRKSPVAKPRKPPAVPADLAAALKQNTAARNAFETFSPSHRREYIAWINEAKQDETRARRIATALKWLVEGKSRNWKYE